MQGQRFVDQEGRLRFDLQGGKKREGPPGRGE